MGAFMSASRKLACMFLFCSCSHSIPDLFNLRAPQPHRCVNGVFGFWTFPWVIGRRSGKVAKLLPRELLAVHGSFRRDLLASETHLLASTKASTACRSAVLFPASWSACVRNSGDF